jgi:hypothetical protein
MLHLTRFSQDCIFELCDLEGDWKEMNINQFVMFVVSASMFAEAEILKMIFYNYDRDGNGFVELEEMESMIENLHGVEGSGHAAGLGMEQNISMMHARPREFVDKFTWPEFQSINVEFPHLFFPAFTFHIAIRTKTFGQLFWSRQQAVALAARTYEADTAKRQCTAALETQRQNRLSNLHSHYADNSNACAAALWTLNYFLCITLFKTTWCMRKSPQERILKNTYKGEYIPLGERDLWKAGVEGFKPMPMTKAMQRAEKQRESDERRERSKDRRRLREERDPTYGAPEDKLKVPVIKAQPAAVGEGDGRSGDAPKVLEGGDKSKDKHGRKKLPPLKVTPQKPPSIKAKLDGGGALKGKKGAAQVVPGQSSPS